MPLDRSPAYIRFPLLDTAKNLHISRYKSIGEGGGEEGGGHLTMGILSKLKIPYSLVKNHI